MPMIAVYDWSQVSTPAALTPDILANSTHANDPATVTYDPGGPSWLNQTYTYTGAAPTHIAINDDDGLFEDGYVETGAAATLAKDVTLNGTTYAAGSVIENEFVLIDGGGNQVWIIRIDGVNVGFAPQVPYYSIPAGASFYPVSARDGMASQSADGVPSTVAYSGVICFDAAARIATPRGPRPAGGLAPGDLVTTLDHGDRPVLWVGHTALDFGPGAHPARPVRIRAGALGAGLPERDLLVSPQHRLLVHGAAVAALFGTEEILVPARALLDLPGVRVAQGKRRMDYVHILLERHEILFAEGAASESFFPGPSGLMMMEAQLRESLGRQIDPEAYGPPARRLATRREGLDLAQSLIESGAPVCSVTPGAQSPLPCRDGAPLH